MPSEQTIDALQLEISVNSSAAEKDLTRLLSTLRSINAVGNRSTGLAKINRHLAEMASMSFGSFREELHSIREDLEAIASIKGINLKSLRNQINATPQVQINEKVGETIQNVNETIVRQSETLNDLKENWSESKEPIQQASEATKDFGNNLGSIKKPASTATTSLKKFWSSIKRIALYRTIRRVLQLIANAFKEGISNIYQYDKAYNGIFSQSMDRLATSGQYWKNSLGAALAPIIVMITPMVENLAEAFANLNNTIGQVFAALAGQSTYIKANSDAIKKYAETAKKALVGFDEINTLSNVNKNYEEMFSTEEISDGLKFLQVVGAWLRQNKDLVKQVLVAFATLAVMDWTREQMYLTNYIRQLAQAKMGTNALTNAFYNKNNALSQQSQATATDMSAVVALAGGFALAASKAGDLSDVISGWDSSNLENSFSGISDVVGGLNTQIGDLRTQLDGLQADLTAIQANESISSNNTSTEASSNKGLFGNIWDGIKSAANWVGNAASTVGSAIGGAVSSAANWVGDTASTVGNAIGSAATSVVDWVGNAASAVGNAVSSAVSSAVDWVSNAASTVGNAVSSVASTVGNAVSDAADWVGNAASTVADAVSTGAKVAGVVSKVIWDNSAVGTVVNGAVDLVSDIGKGIANGASSVGDWVGSTASSIASGIASLGTSLVSWIPFLADGAYDVPTGQLFVAREAGAEMVGSIGGRTTVANNEQIVEAIKQGVIEAMESSSQGGDWTINIVDDDGNVKASQVIKAAQRKNRRDGKTVIQLGV